MRPALALQPQALTLQLTPALQLTLTLQPATSQPQALALPAPTLQLALELTLALTLQPEVGFNVLITSPGNPKDPTLPTLTL